VVAEPGGPRAISVCAGTTMPVWRVPTTLNPPVGSGLEMHSTTTGTGTGTGTITALTQLSKPVRG
jgi:hypothetical protein